MTDVFAERILAGEIEAPFTPPMSATGTSLPKGAAPKRNTIEISALVAGDFWDSELEDEVPTLGTIDGGTGLLYEGSDHYLVGAAGGGKTWLALHLIHEQVKIAGATALFVDYESTFPRFLKRLRQLGVTKEQAYSIGYLKPEGAITKGYSYGDAFHAWLAENTPTFLVIDSVGVALTSAKLDENDASDTTTWWYQTIEPLNKLGITSLRIDHNGKEAIGKNNMDARGSSAKLQRVDGAAFALTTEKHWSKTSNGHAKLTNLKDRNGTFVATQTCANMVVSIEDGQLVVELKATKPAPTNFDGTPRLTFLMDKISRTLAKGALSATDLKAAIGGKATNVIASVETLVAEGFVAVEEGPRKSKMYKLVRNYDHTQDPLSPEFSGQAIDPDRIF